MEYREYKDKRGMVGVVLFLLLEYRNQGIGWQLRDIPQQLDYDYVGGERFGSLNNLNNWLANGRKALGFIKEGTPYYITVKNFKK